MKLKTILKILEKCNHLVLIVYKKNYLREEPKMLYN